MRVLSGPSQGTRHPNPYIKLLLHGLEASVSVQTFTWRRAVFGRYDIIHLHWPEHMLNDCKTRGKAWLKTATLALVIARSKLTGTKLVWTVHNDVPHEQPRLATDVGLWLWQRYADAAIFLTETGRASYPSRRPATSVVIRHGHYGPSIPEAADRSEHRQRPYLVSFGLLRRYKGLDQLIKSTTAARCDFDVVIAGPGEDAKHLRELRSLAGASPRVAIDPRYLPQVELVDLIRNSTGVVLPYHRMNNSGALLMALTLAKRVLVPDSPSNREISDLVGPGWITYFRGPLEPRDLDRFYAYARERGPAVPETRPVLDAFEWDDIIAAHEALYRKLAG
jgi:glycosyltransferase involved in cell wall biosynthesis